MVLGRTRGNHDLVGLCAGTRDEKEDFEEETREGNDNQQQPIPFHWLPPPQMDAHVQLQANRSAECGWKQGQGSQTLTPFGYVEADLQDDARLSIANFKLPIEARPTRSSIGN